MALGVLVLAMDKAMEALSERRSVALFLRRVFSRNDASRHRAEFKRSTVRWNRQKILVLV